MGLLFIGIIFLIASMAVVMGVPFVYYLKRDQAWQTSPQKSLNVWYK